MKKWQRVLTTIAFSASVLFTAFGISQPANAAVTPSKKVVYLTFDDGPSRYTNDIVNTLNRYNAKATFFMLEPAMRQYPDATRNIVRNGNQPALHGVTHVPSRIYVSPYSVVNEMNQGRATLKRLTGVDTNAIRTPYGSKPYMKSSYFSAVHTNGYKVWDWTIDSFDWKYRSSYYVTSVKNQIPAMQRRNKPLIILMHDRRETAASLSQLLAWLRTSGYEMQTISSSSISEFHF